MEVFKSEAREVIRRFVDRRLTFPQCVVALEDALADVTPRLSGPQIPLLHALILQNNSIVMKEMEKRGQPPSDPKILAALRDGITISAYRPGELIYSQGDPGQAVFYIQKGRVKLTAVSKLGKQAVVGILGPGSFVGEGCLKQQPHPATARAIGKCWIERLNKATMNRLLGDNLAFSELFLAHLLSRNVRMQEEMIYQILNSHEKRLARVLLTLADFGNRGQPKSVIPKVSCEALAQIVGITISRVSFFMRKFRKLGFIDYNGKLKINNTLLNVVLQDHLAATATGLLVPTSRQTPRLGRE